MTSQIPESSLTIADAGEAVLHIPDPRRYPINTPFTSTSYKAQGQMIPHVILRISPPQYKCDALDSFRPPTPSSMAPYFPVFYLPGVVQRTYPWSEILDRPPICHEIFVYLSPATLFCLARTCKAACSATTTYTTCAFNIDALLRPFFDRPLAFRPTSQHGNADLRLHGIAAPQQNTILFFGLGLVHASRIR
jgi:hypothetical protein